VTLAGGALNILVGNGFVPQLGDTFTIITAGAGVVGTFAEPDGPNRRIVNGVLYAVIYNRGPNGSVLLQVSTPKPVVDPSNDALAYVENDGARAVDGGLILTEFDSSDITGATVSITGNFQSGQELLAFTDTATISGSLNATGDILTLTGTDTIANYQAALRSVTYTNTSNIPITATRTVTFRATDVNADLSDPATRDITIVSVNDPPAGANKTVSTAEDTPFTFGTADFGFTDPTESPGNALLAVRITTPPAAGSLTNNNVALTVGQSVLATDITGARQHQWADRQRNRHGRRDRDRHADQPERRPPGAGGDDRRPGQHRPRRAVAGSERHRPDRRRRATHGQRRRPGSCCRGGQREREHHHLHRLALGGQQPAGGRAVQRCGWHVGDRRRGLRRRRRLHHADHQPAGHPGD
jgi:hypothetical protein